MVSKEQVVTLVNHHLNRVLSIVELIVPAEKFPVCRRLILDEFGREAFGKSLDGLFSERKRTVRAGLFHAGKMVRHECLEMN
jgi:hypothetical protein